MEFFQLNSAAEHMPRTQFSMSQSWRGELKEKINANLQSKKVISSQCQQLAECELLFYSCNNSRSKHV